jgi:hypothetical protein
MNTVLQIIRESGGFHPGKSISIENEPWMRLVIEVLPELGPDGHKVVSVAHYGEQNSDLMRDPGLRFQVVEKNAGVTELSPIYFRNDYVGVEQWSRYRNESGDLVSLSQRTRELEEFAKIWDRNLSSQGFLEAFRRKCAEASAEGRRSNGRCESAM